jgi:hypothetical protein
LCLFFPTAKDEEQNDHTSFVFDAGHRDYIGKIDELHDADVWRKLGQKYVAS